MEELRVEMQKHWERLVPVLDLEALMAPADGSATRDVPEGAVGRARRVEAALEELRVKIQKHWERLAPVLDLEALIAPTDGSADRDVPQDGAGHD